MKNESANTNANGNEDAGKRLNKIDRSALRKVVGGVGEARPAEARGARPPGERPGNGVGGDRE